MGTGRERRTAPDKSGEAALQTWRGNSHKWPYAPRDLPVPFLRKRETNPNTENYTVGFCFQEKNPTAGIRAVFRSQTGHLRRGRGWGPASAGPAVFCVFKFVLDRRSAAAWPRGKA